MRTTSLATKTFDRLRSIRGHISHTVSHLRAADDFVLPRWRGMPPVTLEAITALSPSDLAPPILDDIYMPPFVGNPSFDDLGAVLRIARHIKPALICEIGTGHGNLIANLLRNCQEARALTVNAPADLQSGLIVTYKLTRDEIGRVYRRFGHADRVTQVLVNSLDLDLSAYVPRGSIDLGIIDGCHDAPYVVNDFEKLWPFVRPGGVVLFHDTHPSRQGHLKESYSACLLLRRRGLDIRWIRSTSWAYWHCV